MPDLPEGIERVVLIRSPGRGWEVADNPYVGTIPGIETKEVIFLADLPKIEQAVVERIREALLLLAITHFDHERLLTDENLDATFLFDAGLLQHREIGQTGEYEAHLTLKGYERLEAALATLDQQEGDRG